VGSIPTRSVTFAVIRISEIICSLIIIISRFIKCLELSISEKRDLFDSFICHLNFLWKNNFEDKLL